MIINAKSIKTKLMMYSMIKHSRAKSKILTNLAIMEAYIQSLITGKPVELNTELVKIPIN